MRNKHRFLIDLLAVLVLVAFGWTIRYTAQGAADPIWTDIQARGVLRVGTDPGYQPFAIERNGQLQGYDVDLVNELAARLQLRVEWVAVGYDALYDALSTRRVDLLAAALPLAPEQGWRARFSTPYLNAGQVLLVPRGSGITDVGALAGQAVGAALGSDSDSFARNVRSSLPTLQVRSGYETPAAAVDALARGDLAAVICDAVSGLAATQRFPQLEIGAALTFEPYVLAMPVEAYQLQSAINGGLEQLRNEQVFERLNTRWFDAAALH